MEGAAELLSTAEADWPPELRLPPPPPPSEPPPAPAMGMDDSQFLGSIMGEPQPQQAVGVKRKRGRPPKNRDGAAVAAAKTVVVKPARKREDEEDVVCFICFDGGSLVLCDRRGCPKVYHPACIKRDEAFFQSRSKWNCGWHICSSCEKAVHYMCYTCTYSLCKVCIKQGKFFSVRGGKGFCDTCFGTILLIESKDEGGPKVRVDFDDRNSWEYLFKLYWLDLKGKLSLTLEELTSAKSRWNVPSIHARKERDESSDDLYDANNDDDAGSDCSSGKRKRTNSSRKRGQKRRKTNSDCSIAAEKVEIVITDAGSLPKKVPSEGVSLPPDTKWASADLLEFVGHMRDSDQSFISQFDVQALLLEYIKQNNLRDPQRKSQIICDSRLHRLFRKTRVAHFEMLKLLEMHFLVSDASTVNDDSQAIIDPSSAQIDASGYSAVAAKLCPDRKRRMNRNTEREPQANLEDYAAVDMHNINLIYLRRSLLDDLIDDATFSDKIAGAFVRIRISGVGQKQDMYRLVKVIGTHKISENYSIGKKKTNFALEILNLSKKEIIRMDTISNQDFTEEECKRLRQSMKFGLISQLKVGDVQEKAKIFQSVRVNDWFENEKQRLCHLRDRASEKGRRKELRECVEKLQLLNTPEERTRRINEVLDVHVDSHMDPDYESSEEMDDKKTVERNVNWTRSDAVFSSVKVKYSNTLQSHAQRSSDARCHPKNLHKQSTARKSGAGRNFENSHSTIGTDISKSGNNVNSIVCEAASLSSSGVTISNDMEPEKVWHYKDPSGNVQGPFTLLQLSKWTNYFPRDMRVWLTFESEERSLLLTEVLSKQPKDFSQAASLTISSKATLADSGQSRNSPILDLNKALSPGCYSTFNSPEITVQCTKHSGPERVSVNSLDDSSLSTGSVPPKDADASNSQVQYQTKHSHFLPSPGSPHGQSDLPHDEIQGGRSGEWNNQHSSGLWNPTMPQTSCSGQSNVESHHNQHASWSQVQHDSKSSLEAGSVKDLNSRRDYSQKHPSQRIGRDIPSPVFASSPSESRTASSQHEGSCLSSATNPSIHDEFHSSIASAKAKSFAPATPIEDGDSSSPSAMLSHSERAPVCSPQSAPSTCTADICKMEVLNQQKISQHEGSVLSSTTNPNAHHEPLSSIASAKAKSFAPATPVEDGGSSSPSGMLSHSERAPTRSLQSVPSASASDMLKMEEITNQHKNPSVHDELHSSSASAKAKSFAPATPVEDRGSSSPSGMLSHSERAPIRGPQSAPSASASDMLKMEEITNQHQNPSVHDELHSSIASAKAKSFAPATPVEDRGSSSPSGVLSHSERAPICSPQSVPSASASDMLKMEVMDQHKSPSVHDELQSSIASAKAKSFAPATPAEDRGSSSPSGMLSHSERDPICSPHLAPSVPASDICKMEVMNQQKTLEADASNASVNQSPQYKISPESSPGNQDIELEYPSPTPRSESKELAVELSGSTSVASETLATKVCDHSPIDYVLAKSCPPTGEIGALISVFNTEKTDLKDEDSNVQNELYGDSTVATREDMMVNPASVAESIDVSDVLESLIEQRCGALYIEGTATLEGFMAGSAEEEPQCSSPIALSPWGEPGYYQGDGVDAALWGIQDDDPINDMWTLSSPTPAYQHSSGLETGGEGTTHFIDEATVTQGNNEIAQTGTTTGEKMVELANSGVRTDWGLFEQVKSEANDASVSMLDGSTGLIGEQPPANEGWNMDNAWSTSHNPNLFSNHETAVPLSKSCLEASRNQECADLNAASLGELGNTKSWDPSSGNANRGSQRSRYSEISESWLLSSNYSRSRSDGFGSGGSSRSIPRGQNQRRDM